MNIISPTIKYTFTDSKQSVTFLDVQIYLSETRKIEINLYRKPTDCMTLLHFYSHHPLSCKESIVYSQALRYNMTVLEDHILQAELNNLTRILLARAYPLHLIIKNIKNLDLQPQLPVIPTNTTYRNQHPPHCNSFLRHGQTTHSHHTINWRIVAKDTTLSTIWPSKPLSAYTKSKSIHNHLVCSAQTYGASQQDS